MLEIQGVIGRIQLRRMADWSAKRSKNAMAIWGECRRHSVVRVPSVDNHDGTTNHAHYKCYVYVNQDQLAQGWSRDKIVEEINALGVPCYQGSCSEVYLEKAFDETGWRPEPRLPMAKELGEDALMFLVHPTLTKNEIINTCHAINKVLLMASR